MTLFVPVLRANSRNSISHCTVTPLNRIDHARSPVAAGGGERFSLILYADGSREDVADYKAAHQFAESLSDVVDLRLTNRDEMFMVRRDGYVTYSTRHSTQTAELNFTRSSLARQIY